MTRFDALDRELDRWEALGRRATLWLRDDDACSDSPALRRLFAIAGEHAVPVTIAAIAATADSTLVDALGVCDEATVVQHGYAHRNHAPPGERSAELGDGRDVRARLDELYRGRARLAQAFRERFAPILVPPWNRAGDALLPHLAAGGVGGRTRVGPRATPAAPPGRGPVTRPGGPRHAMQRRALRRSTRTSTRLPGGAIARSSAPTRRSSG